ncbi:hypothetical protein AVDCRST_MAG94-5130, partial [uncultured Leptolyngbya sp.]
CNQQTATSITVFVAIGWLRHQLMPSLSTLSRMIHSRI